MASRKGQFKKGGGRVGGSHHTKHRKHHSQAMTVYRPKEVVKYRTRTIVKHHRARGGGALAVGRGGFHSSTGFNLADFRAPGIASLFGYSKAGKGFAALNDMMAKLPTLGKAPPEAVAALIAYYFRNKHDIIADTATALMNIAGYEIGQSGYSLSGDDD